MSAASAGDTWVEIYPTCTRPRASLQSPPPLTRQEQLAALTRETATRSEPVITMFTSLRKFFARRTYRRAIAAIPHRFGTVEYALAAVMATSRYELDLEITSRSFRTENEVRVSRSTP